MAQPFGTDGTTGTPYGGTDGHGATTVNAAEIAGNQRRHGDFTLKNVRKNVGKMGNIWEIYGKSHIPKIRMRNIRKILEN